MHYKIYDIIPEESKYIRHTVFIEEQGFTVEIDEHDEDNMARHIVIYEDDKAVATARYFEEAPGVYHAGRIAVLKPYRGMGYGKAILGFMQEDLKNNLKANKITISSQLHARSFYESLGFEFMGDVFIEAGKEHIWCEKAL